MSVSSGSFIGDDGDNILLDEEEEIDFYAILNVSRDATYEEITKAYRRRCRIFHPDRHTNEDDKLDAERVFVQLRRAHEVLSDPKQRVIYDQLGVQGLDTQGWQLVSRSSNPENIRREYEFLKQLRENEIMLTRTHPTSTFLVRTSIAGLLHADPEDRYPPQLLGVMIAQSVDCTLTSNHNIGLQGRVKAGNGRGDGSVAAHWKTNAAKFNIENSLSLSSDSLTLQCRLARAVFERASFVVQPSLQFMYLQGIFMPTLQFVYSMRLRLRWQGSIILALTPVQSAITTNIMHTTVTNSPKAILSLTISPASPNIRAVYFIREQDRDGVMEVSATLGFGGIAPAISYERRLSRYSRVGIGLSFAFPSFLLKARLKIKTGHSAFEWHIVLCDDKDEFVRSAMIGVIFPYVAFKVAKSVFRPLWDRFMSVFDDSIQDGGVNIAKQEESQRVINLMRATAERIRRDELARHGILIEDARFGASSFDSSAAYPVAGDRTIDVSIPLQAMVHDSQLRIHSQTKAQLPGFYDPCPGEAKVLYVRYLFRDEMHAVTVPDDMPLIIPVRSHKIDIERRA